MVGILIVFYPLTLLNNYSTITRQLLEITYNYIGYKHSILLLAIGLIAFEDVAGVDFIFYVVEDGVVAVGDDNFALGFELRQVVDY